MTTTNIRRLEANRFSKLLDRSRDDLRALDSYEGDDLEQVVDALCRRYNAKEHMAIVDTKSVRKDYAMHTARIIEDAEANDEQVERLRAALEILEEERDWTRDNRYGY